jgi:hypothetical protein
MRDFDIVKTLIARKNIQEIRRFKKIIIFRINNGSSKTILKFNDFQIKKMLITTIIR